MAVLDFFVPASFLLRISIFRRMDFECHTAVDGFVFQISIPAMLSSFWPRPNFGLFQRHRFHISPPVVAQLVRIFFLTEDCLFISPEVAAFPVARIAYQPSVSVFLFPSIGEVWTERREDVSLSNLEIFRTSRRCDVLLRVTNVPFFMFTPLAVPISELYSAQPLL